ncbi:MAG TPA: DUF4249 domain-containing protein [Phnomibacter sp.]|nr:DUF4249 domain-containing protein [Phnomibacter sp.]
MQLKNILFIIISAILLSACEKVVEVQYKDNQPRIVIEGNITNTPGPYFVKVSKSIALQDESPNPVVNNAIVRISDNAGNSETLVPQGNGTYRTNSLQGTVGRIYTLTVQADGQTYSAQSTMPAQVPFDSIKVETMDVFGELEYNLIPVYLDPIATGNKYRFVLTVNDTLIHQHFVQNDDIKNGVVNTFRLEINDNDLKLVAGDRIAIDMECIDKQVFTFYSTLVQIADSGPGGGTTPSNPPNNFTNGALGIFSAHTTQRQTAVIH